jgi:rhodanese-related sulfurtransferase
MLHRAIEIASCLSITQSSSHQDLVACLHHPNQESRDLVAIVLDVREPVEYASGHVPGAVNLPQADLADRLEELPRDRPVLLICQGGYRSLRAAQFLKQVGFTQVASVAGGTAAWVAAGKPLGRGEVDDRATRVIETEWAHAGGASAASTPGPRGGSKRL